MENQGFIYRHANVIKYTVLALCIIGLLAIWFHDVSKDKARARDETVGRLTVNGYSDIKLLRGKTFCERDRYGVFYIATNSKGQKERGLVCVPQYGETGYISPSMTE